MVHQCVPEGLRNGASHQIVLKSEGGDVWHDAQLRWNSPNQLQPGYTLRHHMAQSQTSHRAHLDITQHQQHCTCLLRGLVRVRMAVCMHMGSSASMQGHTCSMAVCTMARSQLIRLVSNCKRHDDQTLSMCLLVIMLISVTVIVAGKHLHKEHVSWQLSSCCFNHTYTDCFAFPNLLASPKLAR